MPYGIKKKEKKKKTTKEKKKKKKRKKKEETEKFPCHISHVNDILIKCSSPNQLKLMIEFRSRMYGCGFGKPNVGHQKNALNIEKVTQKHRRGI